MIEKKEFPRYINMLSNKIRRQFDASKFDIKITPAEAKVLSFMLDGHDGIFQKDIEKEFGFRAPTASALLKQMEADGVIKRVVQKEDSRFKKLYVTDLGLTYKNQVLAKITEVYKKMLKDISDDDLESFFKTLNKMISNMD